MADNLDEIIERYNNIWEDIKNGGIPEELPEIDKESCLTDLKKQIADSFISGSKNALKQHLSVIHEVINKAHYLRGLLVDNTREN